MKLERIAISCGGTGGHFNPGLGIAKEFVSRGGSPLIVLGGKNAPGQAEISRKNGIDFRIIAASPKSMNPVKLIRFLVNTVRGFFQCRKAFRNFRPQALLAMGSFASFPPVLAAKSMKIPVFLHDGNARIGKANLFLSRWAKAIAMSFPSVNSEQCCCPAILTGMPIRKDLAEGIMTKAAAVAEINRRWNAGFDAKKPVLLVFGGSLGARTLNTKMTVDPALPFAEELQQIRLVGAAGRAEAEPFLRKAKGKMLILESCQEMNILYSAADLVVSRAGGSSVSEIAVYGKFALLVPYPFAAEHHQDDNASWLASGNGAEIMEDSDCSQDTFSEFLKKWYNDRAGYAARGEALKKIAKPEAAGNVIEMIENITCTEKQS